MARYNARFELVLESLGKNITWLQIWDNLGWFFFILKIVYCVYSLESPWWGDSNENTIYLLFNPTAFGTAKTLWSFGCSECNRVKENRKNGKAIPNLPPELALWLTLSSSNYPCLKHVFMVSKVLGPLKFDCIYKPLGTLYFFPSDSPTLPKPWRRFSLKLFDSPPYVRVLYHRPESYIYQQSHGRSVWWDSQLVGYEWSPSYLSIVAVCSTALYQNPDRKEAKDEVYCQWGVISNRYYLATLYILQYSQ